MGLRDIHATGYAHCDLKPANFMFVKDSNKIKLQVIDFGLIEVYAIDGKLLADRENCCPKGTPNYMSRNCHRGKKLSRRDDLESLMYIVITLLNGFSPWQNLTITSN